FIRVSFSCFSFTLPSLSSIYTLSLHDALPISLRRPLFGDEPALTHAFEGGIERAVAEGRSDRPQKGEQTFPQLIPVHGGLVQERSEEHTSELQSRFDLVCRLLLEKKKQI